MKDTSRMKGWATQRWIFAGLVATLLLHVSPVTCVRLHEDSPVPEISLINDQPREDVRKDSTSGPANYVLDGKVIHAQCSHVR